jgi:hypothetical protein
MGDVRRHMSGSFLLGLVVTLLGERVAVAPRVRSALAIGSSRICRW